jgi:chorismate dehydratase
VTKIDLGAEWKAMTGLPFVYAMWVGRPGAASPAQCRALQEARDRGLEHLPDIADEVSGGDPDLEQRSLIYLRDNLKYSLGDGEVAGLRRFHELVVDVGLMPQLRPLRFYE